MNIEFMQDAWEAHPDGLGGFRPTDPNGRGTINTTCPKCHKPVIREAGIEIVKNSAMKCPEPCDYTEVGEDLLALIRAAQRQGKVS